MQNNSQIISPTSFRIDKYLVSDIYGFNGQIETDERLIRNIIYSVAEDYEHSLFGFGSLDPAKFAERWQYDPSYLRKRVAEPYQLRDLSPSEIESYRERISARKSQTKDESDKYVWDTHLENAIYILASKPFNFNTYGEFVVVDDRTKKEQVFKSHASFTLFSSISAVSRGRGKVVYAYTLNDNFEKNLTRYYIRGERESLLQLRGSGLDSLYLFLTNLKVNLALSGAGKTPSGDGALSFDNLCNLAGVPTHTKDGKEYEDRERKKLLNRALAKVNDTTELKFSVSWVKGPGATAAYTPVIDFGDGHLPRYNVKQPGLGRFVLDEERSTIQRQLIQREFLTIYKKLFSSGYRPIDEEDFNAWAIDNSRSKEEKATALKLAYIGIYGCIPENANDINKLVFDAIAHGNGRPFSDILKLVPFPRGRA